MTFLPCSTGQSKSHSQTRGKGVAKQAIFIFYALQQIATNRSFKELTFIFSSFPWFKCLDKTELLSLKGQSSVLIWRLKGQWVDFQGHLVCWENLFLCGCKSENFSVLLTCCPQSLSKWTSSMGHILPSWQMDSSMPAMQREQVCWQGGVYTM